jgi:hypothetical protein
VKKYIERIGSLVTVIIVGLCIGVFKIGIIKSLCSVYFWNEKAIERKQLLW